MITSLRQSVVSSVVATAAALSVIGIAAAQSESHKPSAPGMQGGMGQGMGGGMGGMMGMMQGCPMMQGSAGGHGMPHLPPGNEKLEMQMHADMMRAMSDVLSKYAARLPDKK
jgi:hypothetical protein